MTEKNEVMLSPELEAFILNWGEKLSHWGLNRTEAQIYTLLFLTERPLTADDITVALKVARSNVSGSLKELQSWGIVRVISVPGERKKHFECVKDVWEVFQIVVHEQKRREIDPMIETLTHAHDELKRKKQDAYAQTKMNEMIGFFDTTTGWYAKVENMPVETIKKYVKMAGKVSQILGKSKG